MRIRLVALAFGALALVACGDDDDSSSGGQIQTDAEGVVDGGDDLDDEDVPDIGAGDDGGATGASGPTGSGVAVIAGETFEFEVECAFAPYPGNPDGILSMRGTGEGGLIVQVSSAHSDADDPDAPPFDHISLERGDESYTALNLAPTQPGFLEIDGKSITTTTEFMIGESAVDTVEGTFEATCP